MPRKRRVGEVFGGGAGTHRDRRSSEALVCLENILLHVGRDRCLGKGFTDLRPAIWLSGAGDQRLEAISGDDAIVGGSGDGKAGWNGEAGADQLAEIRRLTANSRKISGSNT
jgi:hypothetical protein